MKTTNPINKIQLGTTKYKAIVAKQHVGAAPKIKLEISNAGIAFGNYRVRVKAPFDAIAKVASSDAHGLRYFKQDFAQALDEAKKREDLRRNVRSLSRQEALQESELDFTIQSFTRVVNGRTFVDHVSSFHAALVKILTKKSVVEFEATSHSENVTLIAGRSNVLYQSMYLEGKALDALKIVYRNAFPDVNSFLVAVVNFFRFACPQGTQKEKFEFIKKTHSVLVDAFKSHVGNQGTFRADVLAENSEAALMLVEEIMDYDKHRPFLHAVPGLSELVEPLKVAVERNGLVKAAPRSRGMKAAPILRV